MSDPVAQQGLSFTSSTSCTTRLVSLLNANIERVFFQFNPSSLSKMPTRFFPAPTSHPRMPPHMAPKIHGFMESNEAECPVCTQIGPQHKNRFAALRDPDTENSRRAKRRRNSWTPGKKGRLRPLNLELPG